MSNIQIYICDSLGCKQDKHFLGVYRGETKINFKDITCTDTIERFYTTDTECENNISHPKNIDPAYI